MLGRTPPHIKTIRPMRDGVIADFDAAEKMLMYFVRRPTAGARSMRPRLVIGVPPEITPVERRAVKDSGYRVKASEVHLVDEPMAAAIGIGPAGLRAGRQHDHRHRRGHDRHRRDLDGGHGLRPIAARRRRRDERSHHPVHAGPATSASASERPSRSSSKSAPRRRWTRR